MRHEYSENLTLTSTTGTLSSYIWRCNGMFDPNFTSTGHQPMYFDQLGVIYNHYHVFKSRATLEILNTSNVLLAFMMDDDNTIPGSVNQALELPTSKGGLLPVPTTKAHSINLTWDAKKFFGGDIYDNSNLQGYVSADPNEQTYFILLFKHADDVSTAIAQVRIRIVYEAVWSELRTVAQS